METKRNETSGFRITPQLVLGFLIIAVGVIFTLDNLDIVNAHHVLRYWPALLIIYGAVKTFSPDTRGGQFWGVVLMFVGAGLLIDKLDIFYFRLWDFWPLLLVALGGMMIWRTSSRRAATNATILSAEHSKDSSSIVNASAFLGGSVRNVDTKDFRGGEFTAVMGGCDIDLRTAAIANSPAVIDVFAFWGGIEIKVPQSWSVSFEGTPILGGFDDKTFRQGTEATQRLIIRGTIVMGGVEVRN
jgi:predicted membrane protein